MGIYGRIAGIVVTRPWTVPLLAGSAWAFRARHWYRTAPFLPLPPRSYLRWRMDTAYGDPDFVPSTDEFLRYLRWAAEMRRRARRRS
jgi:hypothetical protein